MSASLLLNPYRDRLAQEQHPSESSSSSSMRTASYMTDTKAPSYEPPPGPPPSSFSANADPPPYHDWTVIPDTALLPPPPSISYSASAANASADLADRAHAWTAANPLWPARQLSPSEMQALSIGFASLIVPHEFKGKAHSLQQKAGMWSLSSNKRTEDACILSSIPLYSAFHNSASSSHPQPGAGLAYFEIRIKEMGRDAAVALGYVAPPYPTWRMPGWERASLGVHGDDGRRFVNDTWGGKDFVGPFKEGETLGLGMIFTPAKSSAPPAYEEFKPSASQKNMAKGKQDVKVFLTRNGREEASWDLHEEIDAKEDRPGGVTGLEGERDLYAALGVYGAMECEVVFGRHNWAWRGQ